MSTIKTFEYTIRSYETDANGQVYVYYVLNFLQDAAHRHADELGFGQEQLAERNLFWVLSRLSIEILALPFEGDEILLSTWVKSVRGSISEREFSISIDGEIIINASSLWFCLSHHFHKPAKLPSQYYELMAVNAVSATIGGSEKIQNLPATVIKSEGIEVVAKYSDIDMVKHVNNATYVRWLIDELLDQSLKKTIKKLIINYIDECFIGDNLLINHSRDANLSFTHSIMNTSSNKVICLAKSEWFD